MSAEIRISVRDLVEFIMRSGDLEEGGAGITEEAMLEGARMHRRLQREAGPDYTAEVPMAILYPIMDEEEITVWVEGRADGIFCGPDPDNPIFGDVDRR